MQTISKSRELVSKKLASLEIPSAFALATSASYARELLRPVAERTERNRRDVRRLARQEAALAARGGK